MADVLPEQSLSFGPAGFVPPQMVVPAGFSMPADIPQVQPEPVLTVQTSLPATDSPAPMPAPESPAQQAPAQMGQAQMGQAMQGQQMNGPQMQGQIMPQMQMPGQQMPGQQMPGQQMMQPMLMQPMQQGGLQQMQPGNGQMMQQFVPMSMGMDQGWNQQMQFGQAPAGWVFVPMATMGDGQQMMFDGSQMNQQMFYGGMPQQLNGQQPIPHVYFRPGQDDMGRRGGKQWRGRRKDGDGRRNYSGECHKVFVGGLGPATSAKTLRQYFSQFGFLIDAAVIADGATRRSRGFGFVEFQGGIPDGVLDHEHLIENRRCGVRPYTYRSAPPTVGSDGSD